MSKQELVKLICPQCGKEFCRRPSYLRQYGKYTPCCSKACRGANIKETRAEERIQKGEHLRAANGELRLPHTWVNIRITRDEKYPPRITMDQLAPPLFEMTPDGPKTDEPACIQVIGTPDMRIITTGKLLISKKELNKYVNTAQGLLSLYLHAFMQERKEMEAANGD